MSYSIPYFKNQAPKKENPRFIIFTSHTHFSLFKNIPVHEKVKFQIRAEVFNLFNTPGFANQNSAIGTPPSVVGGTAAIPGNFGTVTSTVNNNRQIQLAGRFTF